jgi:hypothetical protein
VGSSRRVRTRLGGHRLLLERGRHHLRYLQHAWNFYGSDNFDFALLEPTRDEKNELLRAEQFWIDAVGEYNMALVAGAPNRDLKMSAESNRKRSLTQKGRPQTREHAMKRETKLKLRESVLVTLARPEVRQKMSEGGKRGGANGRGRHPPIPTSCVVCRRELKSPQALHNHVRYNHAL